MSDCKHENVENITTTGSVCDTEWCDDCGSYRHVTGKAEYDKWEEPGIVAEFEAAQLDRDKWRLIAERKTAVVAEVIDAVLDEMENSGDES